MRKIVDEDSVMYKRVRVQDKKFVAFFDSGSKYNIMNDVSYKIRKVNNNSNNNNNEDDEDDEDNNDEDDNDEDDDDNNNDDDENDENGDDNYNEDDDDNNDDDDENDEEEDNNDEHEDDEENDDEVDVVENGDKNIDDGDEEDEDNDDNDDDNNDDDDNNNEDDDKDNDDECDENNDDEDDDDEENDDELDDVENGDKNIDDRALSAINSLKSLITMKPVLKIFNPKHEIELHTDASIDGFGAVLLQKSPDDGSGHPVYYMSKKTPDAERRLTSYELELLAVVVALRKFRVYLLGEHFKLISDCDASIKSMNTDDNVYSRLKSIQVQDDELKAIIDVLRDRSSHNNYFMKGGLLHKLIDDNELIVVPLSMQREIIKSAHERGHFSVKKTKEIIGRQYHTPKLEQKIQQQTINSTYRRSTHATRFELLFDIKMHTKDDLILKQIIADEMIQMFNDNRDELRMQAKQQIANIQDENKRSYNLRRKPATTYKVNDLVAIKRTQLGGGLKLKAKYFGPYRVTKSKPNDTYDVTKDAVFYEGPRQTTTCAEFMKPWVPDGDCNDDAFEANE
ncbi:glycosyltransferase-like protein gnt13 [Drosophila albomicans]|uniref:RNA-directed DNA polymerase n=1 Tax=Drosophila albomicans TaxID=7291 RepID=A0A9C6WGY4_DROAB|nr:glycosyltransferase-like protein gnt13 [Drosophila albomicans]